MLRELHIKDFAIIDELHLTLEPGFNILTGETGAGKSILIDAVTLLLGGRADLTLLRSGAKQGGIEGLFELSEYEQEILAPILSREGLEAEAQDVLWLGRELRASGRTVARINGRVVSLSLMREIVEGLVDVHGQSEHLSLFRVREHLNLLDRFANVDTLREQIATIVGELQKVRSELRELRRSERERMQRIDLLRFQVEEIEAANLVSGERGQLEADLVRLTNTEQLTELSVGLLMLLEDGNQEIPAIIDALGQGQRDMDALARIDTSLTPQVHALEEVVYQLEDIARVLRDYHSEIEFDPKRLRRTESRLAQIRRLERKYGGDIDRILAYAQEAADELDALEHSDERIADLAKQEKTLLSQCAVLCAEISQKRQDAAVRLATRVETELDDLRMAGSRVGVAFYWQPDEAGIPLETASQPGRIISSSGTEDIDGEPVTRISFDKTGFDRVEFLVAPNVGEGLKPMTKIASGGETARLMLALKTVLSRADRTSTLIFDEIDQGIGGRVGTVVGKKLWHLTHVDDKEMHHQVLCITHLPQLAGFGDTHFKVTKHIVEGRTVTQVMRLDDQARVEELALMLGTYGEAAQQGAFELLAQAETVKQALGSVGA